jgi:hypothetical protein
MVSSRTLSIIERNPRAPVLRSMAFRAMAPSASSAKLRSMRSISNRVLFNQGVLGLDQDALERRLVEVFEGREHRQPPNELWD